MPLPLPNLDDRRWADLVEEGRALIPLYSPDWSDHNIHDPGVTLIELFAWIAEMDVYQVNRVSDRHRRKFLQLVGVAPRPPRAARVPVSFAVKDNVARLRLPESLECEASDPFGVATRFRLVEAITVVPPQLHAVQRRHRDGFEDLTGRWQRGEALRVLGDDPSPGAALYLGFSEPLPRDAVAKLYFVGTPPAPDQDQSGVSATHHSVRTVWEILADDGRWRPLDPARFEIDDGTRSLTRSGGVHVAAPAQMALRALGAIRKPLWYLRCRVASGTYDESPVVISIAMNTVPAEQAVPAGDLALTAPGAPRVETERLGAGTGRPNQHVTTSQAPIQEASFHLYTIEAGEWREWTRRADLDSSSRADNHYLLEATTGVVTFGDGDRGRVAPRDALIVVSYRTTRGEDGNLAAETITRLAPSGHNMALVTDLAKIAGQLRAMANPVAATGGAAAESVADAQGRVLDELERPLRAVTLEDYEVLARRTPGVRLARAAARAMLHPSFPCLKAPGLITVIVLPFLPVGQPMPGRELLQLVKRHLDRLRSIGTRVEVTGPVYLELTVRATVEACTGVARTALQDRVVAALNRFLDPLTGGPDGTGWPFGRDVYRSEILQVIDQTPGVDHVVSLELVANGGDPQCGNVCLGALGLVFAGRHSIEVVTPRDVS
jgi:predicted phage baseplate assembly protein